MQLCVIQQSLECLRFTRMCIWHGKMWFGWADAETCSVWSYTVGKKCTEHTDDVMRCQDGLSVYEVCMCEGERDGVITVHSGGTWLSRILGWKVWGRGGVNETSDNSYPEGEGKDLFTSTSRLHAERKRVREREIEREMGKERESNIK